MNAFFLWMFVSVVALVMWGVGVTQVEYSVLPREDAEDILQFVSGTEYAPGQEGQVAVMVVAKNGDVVTLDYNCTYEVLYPDKTLFIGGNFTTNTSLNTWYTNFTIPEVDGVYEYSSVCTKGGFKASAGKSFHVTKKRLRAVAVK